ncbi:MAG: hypothetical protein M1834_004505 [Cirrosporium novae-zelandiae]|nr:MAG: hypothetical protein M1834_004505 [Cirrosporium novae-zelandiae]
MHGATTTTTTTRTTRTKPSFMSRLTHRRRRSPRTTATTTHRVPVTHHHRRRPSLGDKVSGAFLKLRGSLTRRPGKKAAGTRRMHGTDGKGSHMRRRYY